MKCPDNVHINGNSKLEKVDLHFVSESEHIVEAEK